MAKINLYKVKYTKKAGKTLGGRTVCHYYSKSDINKFRKLKLIKSAKKVNKC